MQVTQEEYQRVLDELQHLKEENALLEQNFDSMSEGYQESLLLFDQLEETCHELEETNRMLDMARQKAEESSKMKSEFIQQISHEVRTPLNIITLRIVFCMMRNPELAI